MDRPITGFHRDEENDWVAELECGHQQHVRHKPPFVERPWTQTEAGRTSRLGKPLQCPLCDQLEFPEGMVSINRTPVFENATIPGALLTDHATKAGIWAKVTVLQGVVRYVVKDPVSQVFTLNPDTPGIVAPEIKHYIEPEGDVRFYVELFKKDV